MAAYVLWYLQNHECLSARAFGKEILRMAKYDIRFAFYQNSEQYKKY